MVDHHVARRQLLRLVGAGIFFGAVSGNASGAAPGEYIVGTRSRAGTRAARGRANSVRRVLDFGPQGEAVAGRFSEQAVRALSRRADVRYVEPDGRMHAVGWREDIDAGDGEVEWGVDRVDAEKVHGTLGVGGVDVAIVDSGIDSDHPDLPSVGDGVAFVDSRGSYAETWDDDNGHGTHCAGVVGAVDDGRGVVGVAPGVTLHAVKVLDKGGSGYWSDVAAGIRYVTDRGWDVASMSIGGGKSRTVEDACRYAYDRGVLLVAAAGNESENVNNSAPAAYDTVMAVSATDDRDRLASFSNFGPRIELAAPGVGIRSTYPGGRYATMSGTSMACPHVSGASAYLLAAGYGRDAARTALHATAEDLGDAGVDNSYGHGLLDVEAVAVEITGSGGTPVDETAPTAPTNLTATGKTETSVDLAWEAATDDTGVDHYNVYVGGVKDAESATTAATVTGLSAGTTYEFSVTAVDAAGNESGASNVVTETTDPASSGGDTTAPTGSVSAVETPSRNPHAEFEVTWDTRDEGGLQSVELVLTDVSDGGQVEESRTADVTGLTDANGTETLKAHKDDGSGNSFTVTMTVTDVAGNVTRVVSDPVTA